MATAAAGERRSNRYGDLAPLATPERKVMPYNPLDPGGVDDYPVKVGSMLLTLVDPYRGYEKAFNRWYERDHYLRGLPQRSVPACRQPVGGDPRTQGSPLADRGYHRGRSDRRRLVCRHLLGREGPAQGPLRGLVPLAGT